MLSKRALQQGHLFFLSAHLLMQSKQNWCMHPLMDAISVMQEGVSRQMAQVKSAGGLSAVLIGRSHGYPLHLCRTPPSG
jgi:hypothetical protein